MVKSRCSEWTIGEADGSFAEIFDWELQERRPTSQWEEN
jgi:hypothetical protein